MPVFAVIAVLAILIVVHELGHFMAARLQGIHVNRFSLGFGPILWKYQGSETEYAVRAFPLGGFVGFPDDDPDSDIAPDDPNLLRNRPVLDRAIVISAGVIANLIFAYLVLVVQFGVVGIPQASQPGIVINQLISEVGQVSGAAAKAGVKPGDVILEVNNQKFDRSPKTTDPSGELIDTSFGKPVQLIIQRNSETVKLSLTPEPGIDGQGRIGIRLAPPAVAAKAGIQTGDVILAANGKEFGYSPTERDSFQQIVKTSPGKPIQLLIQRGHEKFTLGVTPASGADGQGRIGVNLTYNGKPVRRPVQGVFKVFGAAASEFERIVTMTLQGFGQLITNFGQVANQVSGPVRIVDEGARLARSDANNLYPFAALISINLAIINILPLPALDGGQLAFLLIEGLRGKPLPTRIQDGVMQTGLMLLLGLGLFLIVRDTANLEGVQKLFR